MKKVGAVLLAMAALESHAQEADGGAFVLGTVTVVGQRGAAGDGASVGRQQMAAFRRDDVADALDLLPGVTVTTNSRNEKTVSVRGFDARQVPLFIDGIPVYVPYDGYVDLGRFGTADLAAIQVAKGTTSVAYGANALGGAINLVSRKPRRALEVDARIGLGAGGERIASANVGTNGGAWYLQAGAAWRAADTFPLSSAFRPTATEDGGNRNNADRRDSKLSFKVGLTPGEGDEYALSYYRQQGRKGQPPSTVPADARFWRWPSWDKDSVYFVSSTHLGAFETLRVRLYRDAFDNEVDSYADGTYTRLRTSGKGSVSTGRSIYHDRTRGGSAELESARFAGHTLRLVAHRKTDEHHEYDGAGTLDAQFEDTLSSIGAEDDVRLAPGWNATFGAARHVLRPDSVFSLGNPYSLPGRQAARDAQVALHHGFPDTVRWYVSLARKSRLPTLKDRYSQRLGMYVENPSLRAETSRTAEVGVRAAPWSGATVDAALFCSDVRDRIQSVANVVGNRAQMRNVGQVRMQGAEVALRSLGRPVEVGVTFTWLDAANRSDPATRVTDVPRRKATMDATWHAARAVDFVAFAQYDSARWASNTVRLGGFATTGLKGAWRPVRGAALEMGVDNLADRNYALADGFPAAGRAWFVNGTWQFQ